MRDVEDIGLLKMDFLGLRTLTLLDNCVKLISEQLDVEIDLEPSSTVKGVLLGGLIGG